MSNLSAADDGVDLSADSAMIKTIKRMTVSDSFSEFANPLPPLPAAGARLKVCYAGACITEGQPADSSGSKKLRLPGIQDTTLFSGFEVSGLVHAIGSAVHDSRLKVGNRVVVYNKENEHNDDGFAEYITVNDVRDLIKVPDSLPLEVAAILPSGILRAFSAVMLVKPVIEERIQQQGAAHIVKLLIVGAGALGLTTLKLSRHFIDAQPANIHIVVADTNLKKLELAKSEGCFDVVHWNESIHEEYILMRTRDACRGGTDVIIDFVSSPRTVARCLKVLNKNGLMLVGGNSQYDVMLDSGALAQRNQTVSGIPRGSREQLKQLVNIFSTGKVSAPMYRVYPVAEADHVFTMLSQCQLDGRAVLEISPYTPASSVTAANQ